MPQVYSTIGLAAALKHRYDVDVVPHLICKGFTKEETEDALIEHPELGLKVLTQLKNAGIRISLDDFGTGYSSFSYLHRYPLDCLKIDRSFIGTLTDNPNNKTFHLVQAIHALGVSLGLEVIAEGIETPAQRERLRAIGCQYGQGYLFSPALPADEFEQLLSGTARIVG